MIVDLHLHSNASDGLLCPKDLVKLLYEQRVTNCALTDHDTMNGVQDAQKIAYDYGIALLPGVELSTQDGAEVHMLGYFNEVPAGLSEKLESLRQARIVRMHRMVDALKKAGAAIDVKDIECEENASPGRVHVARALIGKGYAVNVNEAFRRYLLKGRPGYVDREKLTPIEAIALIKAHGGIAVLAHPGIIPISGSALSERMREYQKAGLSGIEAYHPRHTPIERAQLRRYARDGGLLVTGGSDYHGAHGATLPGEMAIDWQDMAQDFNEFLAKLAAV